MPRNDEPTFNRALAEVLRTRNPRWQDIGELLGAEQLDVLREGGRPDIFVDDPDGAPIIIETEYAPARTVELEAQSRLNKTTKETGKIIEQAIALCAPNSLRNVTQDKLVAAVRTTTFKYCLYSANAQDRTSLALVSELRAAKEKMKNSHNEMPSKEISLSPMTRSTWSL